MFDENFKYTKKAQDLDEETYNLLKKLFEQYRNMGHSPRDIAHVMMGTVQILELENVL